jgi:hypothetical protein
MSELFSVIRMTYAATFADAVASATRTPVEAALRNADGGRAVEGIFVQPTRVDLLPRRGALAMVVQLDLGSAPVPALEELLSRLAAAGARDIRLA